MCVCQMSLSPTSWTQIIFHVPDHVILRNISVPLETHTDWERFRCLASDLILPRMQIDAVEEAEKAASAFTACTASAYRLSTRKLTLFEPKQLSGLDHFLRLTRMLRKFWHETRDPKCKTAPDWVTKTIHRLTQKNTIERWETKLSNSKVTPHAFWPLASCEIPYEGEQKKGTNRSSWSFKPQIPPVTKSQCHCRLSGKSVNTT